MSASAVPAADAIHIALTGSSAMLAVALPITGGLVLPATRTAA